MTNEQIQSVIISLQESINKLKIVLNGDISLACREELLKDVAFNLQYDYRDFSIYND